jgi:hypothetical protein
MTIWLAITALLMGCIIAIVFWPELTCWLPDSRNDRREGYADGIGGKPGQNGRSEAYYAGWGMGTTDNTRLTLFADGTITKAARPKRRAF